MTSTGLPELLGVDPDAPKVRAAREDAAQYENLIDSLAEARARQGLSQVAVAERMGTTQSAVSDIERLGGNALYTTLQRMARAVGGHLAARVVFDEWHDLSDVPFSRSPGVDPDSFDQIDEGKPQDVDLGHPDREEGGWSGTALSLRIATTS